MGAMFETEVEAWLIMSHHLAKKWLGTALEALTTVLYPPENIV